MTAPSVDDLIAALAADARPVRPLGAPLRRALAALGLLALCSLVAVAWFGDVRQLLDRYAGREMLMALELAAMLTTGVLSLLGAFFLAIPGRSRKWLLAPLPPFLAWLLLSGFGCVQDLARNTASGLEAGHSMDCLFFILATSFAVGAPLTWLLSRARPIDPLPVALLGGLGSAASAAFLLQFYHPFAVTPIDLAIHFLAILLVIALAGLLNRRALKPA